MDGWVSELCPLGTKSEVELTFESSHSAESIRDLVAEMALWFRQSEWIAPAKVRIDGRLVEVEVDVQTTYIAVVKVDGKEVIKKEMDW